MVGEDIFVHVGKDHRIAPVSGERAWRKPYSERLYGI
jgi:hypothetical protein